MLNFLLLCSFIACGHAFLCSHIDIGTDVGNIGNIVSSGVLQEGWSFNDAAYKASPPQSLMYFYVKGLGYIGPDFENVNFRHEDQFLPQSMKWLFMNVSKDDEQSEFFNEYSVYKVTQQCLDRGDGGTTLRLNVTFAASGCDPITVNWLKVCGEPTAVKSGLSIGMSSGSSEVVYNGVPTPAFDGNLKDNVYRVSTDDESLTLYIQMLDNSVAAFFKPPYILTDHEILYPTILGTAIGGGWVDRESRLITIYFNCLKKKLTKTEVMLVVELPYFHDLEIHFYKVCGKKATSLSSQGWTWGSIFKYGGLVALAALIGLGCYKYKSGDLDIESIPVLSYFYAKYKFYVTSGNRFGQPYDRELPDIEYEKSPGPNVQTQYGTLLISK